MSRTVFDKAVCDNCGVDVRENTLFCYNCGSPVIEPAPPAIEESSQNAGAEPGLHAKSGDLAKQIRIEPPTEAETKRAKAAAERKKARTNSRSRRQIVWEPAEDTPDRLLLLVSLLISIVAGVIVVMTILWK